MRTYANYVGQKKLLRWFNDNYPFKGYSPYIINYVPYIGPIDLEYWLRAYPMLKKSKNEPSRLDSIKWLKNTYSNFICVREAIESAAFLGELDVLVWLNENFGNVGCTRKIRQSSEYFFHLECFAYVLMSKMKGSEANESEQDVLDSLDTLFLLEHSCPLEEPRMNGSTLV